jgi:hypothetical protein
MSDEGSEGTLNTGGDSSTPATSSDGDLVSTVDFAAPAPAEEPLKTEGDAKPDDTKGDAQTDDKGDADRFDKHPRFIELNERVKAAEEGLASAQLENRQMREELTQSQEEGGKKEGPSQDVPFKRVEDMADDDVLEWMQEDPKGYHRNVVAQVKHEMGQSLNEQLEVKDYENQVEHTFSSFAKENPDFDKMWDTGELKRFMDNNPGHNAISAFLLLTGETATQTKIDEAVKEAEDKAAQSQKTRRESQLLASGPSSASSRVTSDVPVELKDTKKHGGLTSVLARRSEERTRAKTG